MNDDSTIPPSSRPSQTEREWGPLRPISAASHASEASFQADRTRQQAPSRKAGLRRLGFLGAAALFLFGKAKWLFALLKFAKFGSFLSMLGTVWVYSMFFGWPFAAGFVLLIFIHEMGHALALKQQGIPSGAPVFIPFVGAFIAMRGRPRDAFIEAVVGIGGPLLGTIGAALCLVAAHITGIELLYALASVGFLLNLFNMIPISPLDGGRIAGAISRGFWVVGYAVGITAFLATFSPILGLILFLGLFTIIQQWRNPVPGYYAIPTSRRLAVATSYFGLMVLMVFGMAASDVPLEHLKGGQAALGAAAGAHVFGGLLYGKLRDVLARQTSAPTPI